MGTPFNILQLLKQRQLLGLDGRNGPGPGVLDTNSRVPFNLHDDKYNVQGDPTDPPIDQSGPSDPLTPPDALTAYKRWVDSAPNRDDYKPKWWELGIGGLAAGVDANQRGVAAGIDTGRQVMGSRYGRAMGDYARRGQGLRTAAELEEKSDAGNISKFRALETARHNRVGEGRAERGMEVEEENLKRKKGHDLATAKTEQEKMAALESYRNAMLGVRRTSAETGRRHASAYESDVASRIESRKNRPQRDPNQRNLSDAEWNAMRSVLGENPEYRRFVPPDDNGNLTYPQLPEDASEEDKAAFSNFMIEIRKRTGKRLGRPINFGGSLKVNAPGPKYQSDMNDDEELDYQE